MIRRVAQGVYTLVGARVTPSEIETKAKTAIGHARLNYQSAQDCGWRPDASGLWATYRVSEPMLLSGKLAAPDEFKTYLDSRGYELRDLEGSRIGHVDVMDARLSGFLPFFRQRRVDLGDHLRVTFDLAKRVALVRAQRGSIRRPWITAIGIHPKRAAISASSNADLVSRVLCFSPVGKSKMTASMPSLAGGQGASRRSEGGPRHR